MLLTLCTPTRLQRRLEPRRRRSDGDAVDDPRDEPETIRRVVDVDATSVSSGDVGQLGRIAGRRSGVR